MSKLALGTVQFGLNYGINNLTGKVNSDEIIKILQHCQINNIDTIDTAQAYGSSEEELGKAFQKINFEGNIISKLSPKNVERVFESFDETLEKLNVSKIYGFMYHDFNSYKNCKSSYEKIQILKEKKQVKKIGFSLYFPSEIEELLENNIQFDLVQLPYNIFDRRFEPYFEELKKRNVEIHIRSVFLQGLFFSDTQKLSSHFDSVKEKLLEIKQISNNEKVSISALCLGFVSKNENIEKIVVGIDNLQNLQENIKALNEKVSQKTFDKLNLFTETNEDILLPYKWKK
jgi:aryl-alcohol dehydrogenase-like predicted oxidoreductase